MGCKNPSLAQRRKSRTYGRNRLEIQNQLNLKINLNNEQLPFVLMNTCTM